MATVCWTTECQEKFFRGLHKDNTRMTVMGQKYPTTLTPKASSLVVCDVQPLLEYVC